ncbi:MAG: hypothetical protein H6668_18335 [Ardenticatenaceae bacterium]|nr:hypothetical protein [Ardenticatenaceae bacterium]
MAIACLVLTAETTICWLGRWQAIGRHSASFPVIGDIIGTDGRRNYRRRPWTASLRAWHEDGTARFRLPHDPPTGGSTEALPSTSKKAFSNWPIDNDSKMEIFIAQSWSIAIIDSNGQQ